MMSNLTTIHERTASLPKQGDAATNTPVVSGVKVLGIESKNGRKYPIEVMRKALEKYEGAIVNIDHPAGSEPRSYEDRFGRLTNARMEADGIYADLAYNPKHPLAEGFQWWVKNDPKAIGLSHNAQAKTKMNTEGVEEIEEIVKVDSVDLVAEPATTAGLMECVMRAKETKQPVVEGRSETDEKYRYDLMNNIITPYFMKQNKDNFTKMMDGFNKYLKNKDIGNEARAKIEKAKKSILDRKNSSGFTNAINIIHGIDTYGYKESETEMKEGKPESAKLMGLYQKLLEVAKKFEQLKREGIEAAKGISNVSNVSSNVQYWADQWVENLSKNNFDLLAPGLKQFSKMFSIPGSLFEESKPTKKLNVTEAKKRKAYKRMLVSEAIKEILTIRKGV